MGYSTNAYLFCFYFSSFIVSLFVSVELYTVAWNPVMISIGSCVGMLSVLLMIVTAKAIRSGPVGVTFAFQNASAVFPVLLLFLVFGQDFGFMLTTAQIVGMGLIILGLFLAAVRKNNDNKRASIKWLQYVIACFLVQMVILTIFHWRCLLFKTEYPSHMLIPCTFPEAEDVWFMPSFFGMASLFQGILLCTKKKIPEAREIMYGLLGGIANSGSTTLLLLATKWALPLEKGLLFPCFAVSVILLSNLWERLLYKAYVDVRTIILCSAGVILGSF